jgi:hypothetical protein
MYTKAGTAQVLAVLLPDGNYSVKLDRAALNQAKDEWKKRVKSGTLDLFTNLRKRDPSKRNVSVFDNPRRFAVEMLNFIRNNPSLTVITTRMANLAEGISTQQIITALLTSYVYDRTSPNHASLVYHAVRNISSIAAYLDALQAQRQGSLGGLGLDKTEQGVLAGFSERKGPEGVSTAVVESALRKVGITGASRMTVSGVNMKVINGQFFGADQFMRETLSGTLTELIRSRTAEGKTETRAQNNLLFADLQKLSSINFSGDYKEFSMTADEKTKYIDAVLPSKLRFGIADKEIRKLIKKKRTSTVEIQTAYAIVQNSTVDYNSLARTMGPLSPNIAQRIGLDSELQNVKLYRLHNEARAAHGISLA